MKLFLITAFIITYVTALSANSNVTTTCANTSANPLLLHVIDGDTIVIKDNKGQEEKVRLYGINSTEIYSHQPFSVAAKNFVEAKLQGSVRVEYQCNHLRDKYGRLLAIVYPNNSNISINEMLVKEGLAISYFIDPELFNKNGSFLLNTIYKAEAIAYRARKNIYDGSFYKNIHASQANQYIAQYAIVQGKVSRVYVSAKGNIWYRLGSDVNSFSVMARKCNNSNNYLNKKIIVKGVIKKGYGKYGPSIFINNCKAMNILH